MLPQNLLCSYLRLKHCVFLRFQLNPADSDQWQTGRTSHTLLDKLMEEIPGLNNYGGELYDTGLTGEDFFDMDGKTKKDVSRYCYQIITLFLPI